MDEELDREMWRRICGVLDEVMDLPEAQRFERLERGCAGSADLRRWVVTLLEASDRAGDFLERPTWPEAAKWVREILDGRGPCGPPTPFRKVRKAGKAIKEDES
jgi:hypothetical protein